MPGQRPGKRSIGCFSTALNCYQYILPSWGNMTTSIARDRNLCYNLVICQDAVLDCLLIYLEKEVFQLKHVKTLNANTLKDTMKKGGCGECQTSCQSACKTSCTVANQKCEHAK